MQKKEILTLTKNKTSLKKIHNIVSVTNKLITHTLQLLNLYCIYVYKNDKPFPKFNTKLILFIFKLLSRKDFEFFTEEDETYIEYLELRTFFETYYVLTMVSKEDVYNDLTNNFLFLESKKLISEIIIYIQEKFMPLLYSLIKGHLGNYRVIKSVRGKKKYSEYGDFRNMLEDMIRLENNVLLMRNTGNTFSSDEVYHEWIVSQSLKMFGHITQFKKDNVNYHLRSDPLDFIKSMSHVVIEIDSSYGYSFRSILPLKNCLQIEKMPFNSWTRKYLEYSSDLDKNEAGSVKLWNRFFDLYITEIGDNLDFCYVRDHERIKLKSTKTDFDVFQLYCKEINKLNFAINKDYDQNVSRIVDE